MWRYGSWRCPCFSCTSAWSFRAAGALTATVNESNLVYASPLCNDNTAGLCLDTVPLCPAHRPRGLPRCPQDSPGSPGEQLEAYCAELEGTAVWGGQLELGALAQVRWGVPGQGCLADARGRALALQGCATMG